MQISVAHACERPAEFLCKMHKATPLRHRRWLIRPFSFGFGFHCRRPHLFGVITNHFRNPPDDTGLARFGRLSFKPLASTALALGWGSLGANPLKDPTYGDTQVLPCI